jgi:hypothetical protein
MYIKYLIIRKLQTFPYIQKELFFNNHKEIFFSNGKTRYELLNLQMI